MANTLQGYLKAIRVTLDAALCIRNFASQVVERHNKPEIEARYTHTATQRATAAVQQRLLTSLPFSSLLSSPLLPTLLCGEYEQGGAAVPCSGGA